MSATTAGLRIEHDADGAAAYVDYEDGGYAVYAASADLGARLRAGGVETARSTRGMHVLIALDVDGQRYDQVTVDDRADLAVLDRALTALGRVRDALAGQVTA